MFTGIIEERGIIADIAFSSTSAKIKVICKIVKEDVKIGDSIAVNGICLTVTDLAKDAFFADISEETLKISTAKHFKRGLIVNLERAVRLNDRLSGHIVTGHVDTCGDVILKRENKDFCVFTVSIEDKKMLKYVIQKGSIAIDGISLTINEIVDNNIRLNIIPHTLKNTNLEFLKVGDKVNLEFDIIGKYIERLLEFKNQERGITEDLLIRSGFMGGILK
ncbi:MAG: riboflavin synthase [Thermodesulfovibrio sp.]|nr:riboflavin synthase [Thermodesulfovibrio sp.]